MKPADRADLLHRTRRNVREFFFRIAPGQYIGRMTAIADTRTSSSTTSLVIANLIPIVLAVLEGWSLQELMLIYWVQSVLIGVFTIFRILSLENFSTQKVGPDMLSDYGKRITKRMFVGFFIFHYGIFHSGYLAFLTGGDDRLFAGNLILLSICISVFVFNHWYSYIEQRDLDSRRTPQIDKIMYFPYARIVSMHATIALGAALGELSTVTLLVFLGLKTTADVIMHRNELSGWER